MIKSKVETGGESVLSMLLKVLKSYQRLEQHDDVIKVARLIIAVQG